MSIEVSPDLAYDSEKTIAEAKHLFSTIGKKNILIKVPATPQGVPAIEKLTADGVNVNVTLLFSVKRYEEIAWAYIQGLEKRSARGLPIGDIASVASFFVSRVDTLIDKLLETRMASSRSEAEKSKLKNLHGPGGGGQRPRCLPKVSGDLRRAEVSGLERSADPTDPLGQHRDQKPGL